MGVRVVYSTIVMFRCRISCMLYARNVENFHNHWKYSNWPVICYWHLFHHRFISIKTSERFQLSDLREHSGSDLCTSWWPSRQEVTDQLVYNRVTLLQVSQRSWNGSRDYSELGGVQRYCGLHGNGNASSPRTRSLSTPGPWLCLQSNGTISDVRCFLVFRFWFKICISP